MGYSSPLGAPGAGPALQRGRQIRVMVVDDSLIVRAAFSRLVDQEADLDLAAAVSTAEDALTLLADDDYRLKSVVDVVQTKFIKRGVPMRTGHEVVGKLVAECEQRKCRLQDLSLTEIRSLVPTAAAPLIDDSVSEVLGSANAAAALVSYGSGSRERVTEQLAEWKKRLNS